MEPSSPISFPFHHSELFGYPLNRGLGATDPLPCDQFKATYSHLMSKSYKKISDGGLLLSLLPGVRTRLYLGPVPLSLIDQFILLKPFKHFPFRAIPAF